MANTPVPGDRFNVTVTAAVTGGYLVRGPGGPAFLRAWEGVFLMARDSQPLVGRTFEVEVRRVGTHPLPLVTRMKVLEQEELDLKRRRLAELGLKPGDLVQGTVEKLLATGVLVNVGGICGILRRKNMAGWKVSSAESVVCEGEQVRAKVLRVRPETGDFELGLKQVDELPWEEVEKRYAPGTRVRGRVVRVADIGGWVELGSGVVGFVHRSELRWGRKVEDAASILDVGVEEEFAIHALDPDRRRVSLSLRALDWDRGISGFSPGQRVRGRVANHANFGIFVELAKGVIGLLHRNEIPNAPPAGELKALVPEGAELDLRILSIDAARRRLALTLNPTQKEEGHV